MVYVLILRDHLFKSIISIQVVEHKKKKSDFLIKLPEIFMTLKKDLNRPKQLIVSVKSYNTC